MRTPRFSLFAVILGAAVLGSACASQPKTAEELIDELEATAVSNTEEKLREATNGAHRLSSMRRRDRYRHPHLTLKFFGIEDNMKVVELFGGYGYYADILAPILAENGTYVMTGAEEASADDTTSGEEEASADASSGEDEGPTKPKVYGAKQTRYMQKRVAEKPEIFGNMQFAMVYPPSDMVLGEAGSADAVLSFRGLHTWMKQGWDAAILQAVFDVLKPGGIFGITDNRSDPGATNLDTGYVSQKDAIALIEAAGFTFVDESEANANRRDTKDYEGGVWALPPIYAEGKDTRDKYKAIGESDRFTLKFVKP